MIVSQRVSGTAVTRFASWGSRVGGGCRGARPVCGRVHLSWQLHVWRRERGGPGGAGDNSFFCYCSFSTLRHRDDAPSPLLLGILATETQKKMKEEEELKKER